VERAEQEVVARRARRVVWAFRTLVYGGAAIAAAVLLTGSGDERRPTFLEGSTAQGRPFSLQLEDGRPTHLGTTIEQTCNNGLAWPACWWSFDGKTTRFRFADGRLTVREKLSRDYGEGEVGERNYTLEARIADGRVAGTMRLIENVTWSGGRYVCESGDVTFFAGAG